MSEIKEEDFTTNGKVDVRKLNRLVLKTKYPTFHKLIVFCEWTFGIGYIWLVLAYMFFGVDAAKRLLVFGLILALILYPIMWVMSKYK